MANWLKDFMGRTPFAILGAIGLLSMASQFINLADDIENWLKVWKDVTRPVWEWIAGLVGYELPNWLKDYLTVGVIHAGMMLRAKTAIRGRFYGILPLIRNLEISAGRSSITIPLEFFSDRDQVPSIGTSTFRTLFRLVFTTSLTIVSNLLVWPPFIISEVLTFYIGRSLVRRLKTNVQNIEDRPGGHLTPFPEGAVRLVEQNLHSYARLYVEAVVYFAMLLALSGALLLAE